MFQWNSKFLDNLNRIPKFGYTLCPISETLHLRILFMASRTGGECNVKQLVKLSRTTKIYKTFKKILVPFSLSIK